MREGFRTRVSAAEASLLGGLLWAKSTEALRVAAYRQHSFGKSFARAELSRTTSVYFLFYFRWGSPMRALGCAAVPLLTPHTRPPTWLGRGEETGAQLAPWGLLRHCPHRGEKVALAEEGTSGYGVFTSGIRVV